MVLTLLGTTGLVTAVLELKMAANVQYQARAFEAAEFGIEQAMHSAGLATSIDYANPVVVPSSGTAPTVPGSPPDAYTYRIYYDASTDPPADAGTNAGLKAYHFVVEATGTSARGATDTHVQGFYVLGPEVTARGPDTACLCARLQQSDIVRTQAYLLAAERRRLA